MGFVVVGRYLAKAGMHCCDEPHFFPWLEVLKPIKL